MLLAALLYASCSSVDYSTTSSNDIEKRNKPNDEFSIITYNIKTIYEKDEEQLDSLINYINKEKFDFVLFQEIFNETSRDYIIENSDTNFYSTFISRVDYNTFPSAIFQDAGLYMMSSYPRIDLSGLEFDDDIDESNGVIHYLLEKEVSRSSDYLANKSVMGALFQIDDSTKLFLFNTHVQALGTREHKDLQLDQINYFISSAIDTVLNSDLVDNPESLIVMLTGDFNSNAYEPNSLINLTTRLGNPRDLHIYHNGNKQEYTFRFRSGRNPRRYDYIFAYDSLNGNKFCKVETEYINVKDIKDKTGQSISDHKALKAGIKIR